MTYYCTYYFPLNNKTPINVGAYELIPSNLRAVHHVWLYLVQDSLNQKFKGKTKGEMISKTVNLFEFDTSLADEYFDVPLYTPGSIAHKYPKGYAEVIKPNTVIVLQVHYSGTGKEEKDSSVLNIYAAKEPITSEVHIGILHEGYILNGPFIIHSRNSVRTLSFTISKDTPPPLLFLAFWHTCTLGEGMFMHSP